MMPVGTASPKAWVAWSTSAQVAPPSTRTVRASGSTRTLRIPERSITSPSSATPKPPPLCPPPRTAKSISFFAGEVHAADDVGHIGAAGYHARALVDHGVVDLASFIVVWITGLEELSTQARLELLYGRFIDHDGSPFP